MKTCSLERFVGDFVHVKYEDHRGITELRGRLEEMGSGKITIDLGVGLFAICISKLREITSCPETFNTDDED